MKGIGAAIQTLLSPAVLVAAAVLALAVVTGLATRIGLLVEDLTARGHESAAEPMTSPSDVLFGVLPSDSDDSLRKEPKVKRFTVPRVAHCSEGCATPS